MFGLYDYLIEILVFIKILILTARNSRFFMPKKPDLETVIIRSMEREEFLILRNELINTHLGELLLKYLHNLATERACRTTYSGDQLKGFAEAIQCIKDIPSKV